MPVRHTGNQAAHRNENPLRQLQSSSYYDDGPETVEVVSVDRTGQGRLHSHESPRVQSASRLELCAPGWSALREKAASRLDWGFASKASRYRALAPVDSSNCSSALAWS